MGIERFIQTVAVQTAVYWAAPTADGYGGFAWPAPVEISCRWQDSIKIITAANGSEIVSKAEILLTQDVDEQGMLYLGELDDLSPSEEADPRTINRAYSIRRFDKIPMIKSTTEFVRKAYL